MLMVCVVLPLLASCGKEEAKAVSDEKRRIYESYASKTPRIQCQATLPGLAAGGVVRIEAGDEKRFGYPPGIYEIVWQADACRLVVSDKEKADGGKWQEARRRSYSEWEAKTKPLREEILKKVLFGGEKPKICPAPFQRFSPGDLVLPVTTNMEKELGLAFGATYFLDQDCHPVLTQPRKVDEIGSRLIDKKREEDEAGKTRALVSAIFAWLLGALVIFFAANALVGMVTGRTLLYRLRVLRKRI